MLCGLVAGPGIKKGASIIGTWGKCYCSVYEQEDDFTSKHSGFLDEFTAPTEITLYIYIT